MNKRIQQIGTMEYKTRRKWVGKVIYRELYKRLKFDHTNKWSLHKSESVPENDTHKITWNFEILTNHLNPSRRQDLVLFKKKKIICA